MRWLQRDAPAARIDLDDLPPEVRALLEAAVVGEEVTLTRGGEPLGTLSFTPRVLQGAVLHADDEADEDEPATPHTEGVTVVATAMRLSKAVRARLLVSAHGLGKGTTDDISSLPHLAKSTCHAQARL